MKSLSWLDRIPRTRLYLSTGETMRSLARLLLAGPEAGPPVPQFEREFAARWRRGEAVAGSYARICFYHALKALDLPPGSEIVTTPITIHDIINMILCAGHRPVFVDIDPANYQMDPAALERAITSRTRAVLLTHLFGIVPDMVRIARICQERKVALIEDASHSFGATLGGRLMGTFGRAGIFSLSSLKSVTSGYGGVILSDDRDFLSAVRESLNKLRACEKKDVMDILTKNLLVGLMTQRLIFCSATFPAIRIMNKRDPAIVARFQTDNPVRERLHEVQPKWLWRFSPLQAAMALRCLRRLDAENEKRRFHAHLLLDILRPQAADRLPSLLPDAVNVFWRFPFRAPEGREFVKFMNRYGVDVATTLMPCCTQSPVFGEYAVPVPQSERVAREVYFLPVEHGLSEKQVTRMAQTVSAFVRAGG